MTQDELKMELEELAVRFSKGWHEGIKIDASDIMLLNEAAQALAQPDQEHYTLEEIDNMTLALTGDEGEDTSWEVLQSMVDYVNRRWPGKSALQVLRELDDHLSDSPEAQPQRIKPLTDDQIDACWSKDLWKKNNPARIFARAIEAKLKDKNS